VGFEGFSRERFFPASHTFFQKWVFQKNWCATFSFLTDEGVNTCIFMFRRTFHGLFMVEIHIAPDKIGEPANRRSIGDPMPIF
jgi:hypothetical protein